MRNPKKEIQNMKEYLINLEKGQGQGADPEQRMKG